MPAKFKNNALSIIMSIVNAHKLVGGYAGIGGFANITHAAKTIVFCMSFTTKGLIATDENGEVQIKQEGTISKFKKEIGAISFSGKNALKRRQRVLYVTERCVFELTEKGLIIKESTPVLMKRVRFAIC